MKAISIAALALAMPIASSAVFGAEGHHWSYSGEGDPSVWAELSDDNKACGLGTEQSPIDIETATAIPADFANPELHWQPFKPIVENNGHTIQIGTRGAGGYVTLGGVKYDLLQFHFHGLSEHTVDGAHSPMEVHFVHKSEAGDLLVLGVLLDAGTEDDPTIAAVWPLVPKDVAKVEADATIDPTSLLPADRDSFRYEGSLTTPPCSEIVTWNVYAGHRTLSPAQIATYESYYTGNFRPVQALNRRFVLVEHESK